MLITHTPASRLSGLLLAPPWEAGRDSALETRGLPVHKLSGALGPDDRRHHGVDLLSHHNPVKVHETAQYLFTVARIALDLRGSRHERDTVISASNNSTR